MTRRTSASTGSHFRSTQTKKVSRERGFGFALAGAALIAKNAIGSTKKRLSKTREVPQSCFLFAPPNDR